MKYRHYLISVLFLLFAIVQWNDPDPYTWIALYLFVALVPILYVRIMLVPSLIFAIMVPLIVKLGFLVPDVLEWIDQGMPTIAATMQAESPHIELVREFFGIVICLIVLGFYYSKVKKRLVEKE